MHPSRAWPRIRRATLAAILCALPAAAGGLQAARVKLERFPEEALLASGRIVEAGRPPAARLVLRGNTAGADREEQDRLELVTSSLLVGLERASGDVYFLAQDRVLPLAKAWGLLRPGQVVEIAAHPEGDTTVRRVRRTRRGDPRRPTPGVPAPLSPARAMGAEVRQAIEIEGPIYVWVLSDPRGSG